jgi:hypothetical protein
MVTPDSSQRITMSELAAGVACDRRPPAGRPLDGRSVICDAGPRRAGPEPGNEPPHGLQRIRVTVRRIQRTGLGVGDRGFRPSDPEKHLTTHCAGGTASSQVAAAKNRVSDLRSGLIRPYKSAFWGYVDHGVTDSHHGEGCGAHARRGWASSQCHPP